MSSNKFPAAPACRWASAVLTLLASAVGLHAQSQVPSSFASNYSTNHWLPPETSFRKVILDEDATINGEKRDTIVDPMEMAVAADGRVFFVERSGVVKMWKPANKTTSVIAKLAVFSGNEDGMLGITLDPNFSENNWVYLNYALPESFNDEKGNKMGLIRVSRFTLTGDTLDLASETKVIDIPEQRITCCHVGGSLTFDAQGNLYVSVGDNTNPFESDGFSPADDRPGREPWDAQRSAGSGNSLTGKILRVKPRAHGGYDIPEGNLFKPGTAGTRPEIYVMGNRNPFRISVDRKTGYLYWGEVGPDSGSPDPKRGPAGFDEVNQARAAGFFGWPYFVADNKPYVPIDFRARQTWRDQVAAYDKAKKEAKEGVVPVKPANWPGADFQPVPHDAARPVNHSPNNTGIKELPPAQPAFIYYPASPSTRFPVVGSGGRTAMAGPIYYFDPNLKSETKLPAEFDHTLFIYEWSRNWIIAVKLDSNDRITGMQRFMPGTEFKRPMDMEMGPDGCLYLIEYGKEWGGNLDTKIVRVEYTGKTGG